MSPRPRRTLPKIDWDTVELVAVVDPPPDAPTRARAGRTPATSPRVFPERRGRSTLKKLLSGASARARSRGAIYTHAQLRQWLTGFDRLCYGWGLLAAAIESSVDFGRGVESAARTIEAASRRLASVA